MPPPPPPRDHVFAKILRRSAHLPNGPAGRCVVVLGRLTKQTRRRRRCSSAAPDRSHSSAGRNLSECTGIDCRKRPKTMRTLHQSLPLLLLLPARPAFIAARSSAAAAAAVSAVVRCYKIWRVCVCSDSGSGAIVSAVNGWAG